MFKRFFKFLCSFGLHSYPYNKNTAYNMENSPYLTWRGLDGKMKFGRHCKHCDHWDMLECRESD